MGIFTWTDCQDRRKKIQYGGRAYVPCPDGSVIYEKDYFGYGCFGGKDIYELIIDWNRERLDEIFRRMRSEREFSRYDRKMEHVAVAAMEGDPFGKEMSLRHFVFCKEDDWKRELGILIACEDSDNRSLPFPIKISGTEPRKPYRLLKPSFCTQ